MPASYSTGYGCTLKEVLAMDDFIDMLYSVLPDEWSVYDEGMGMDALLEAPDGCVIEMDGRCPHGHTSPLRSLGLV